MHAIAIPSPHRSGKRPLLASCAIAASLVALAHGGSALAQVAGSGSFVTGGGAGSSIVDNPGTNTTTVTVGTSESVINWVPTDNAPTGGAIDILPAGENLDFIGTGDYTVLNRFVDGSGGALGRQVALNGTVNGYIGGTSGPRGGNIWFYNAGGILIGASGVINVGSLLLTSNDIDTSGGLFGPGGTIRLAGASGSVSAITVNGTINAGYDDAPGSSYVALVAPRVVQAGTVRVDGSAAYVAAEAANIRINGGLFDIDVTVGAEGGTVINHTGTTTGPAHLDSNGNQSRIYMVAIPKNDAVTMLVGGAIGYDDAISAQIDPDGAVRLSAGFDIVGGELASSPENATAANIAAADTLFRSDTVARASGTFIAAPTQTLPGSPPPLSSAGQFYVEGNGSFTGDAGIALTIGAGQLAGAAGDFTLDASGGGATGSAALTINGGSFAADTLAVIASGATDAITGDIAGGTASLNITDGALSATVVSIEANGLAEGGGGSTSANGTGGTASFSQSGGTVSVGDLSVAADGAGGMVDGQSGVGAGGSATIDFSGGTITASDITASAEGRGGGGSSGNDADPLNIVPGGLGGEGRGGTATINISGTALVEAGVIQAIALGTGGRGGEFFNVSSFSGLPGAPGDGAEGIGGNATVNVTGGTTLASSMIADASGIGGDGGGSFFSSSSGGATGVGVGGTGGVGRGGTATIALEASIPDVVSVSGFATGSGGVGGTHNVGGTGGDGFGGVAQTIVTGFEAGELAVSIDSTGTGGNGGNGNDGDGGSGGSGTGGTSRMQADGAGASLIVVDTNFLTDGVGGNGGSGGLNFGSFPAVAPDGGDGGGGIGGTLEIAANDGAAVTLGLSDGSSVALGSTGRGGAGGTGANSVFGSGNQAGDGGNGGTGTGGTVRLVVTGGTIDSGGEAVDFTAAGLEGEGGSGGIGQGGGIDGALGAMGITAGGRVEIEAATGPGGPGQIDLGPTTIVASGDTAGRIELRASGGNLNFAGLNAQAFGLAAPTNNDTDEAASGIFVAPAGGTIASQGDVTLATDGSIGVYGQSNGSFDVDGSLTIDAGDQIDLRHDNHEGTAPTLNASGDLTMTAATSISGAAGSLAAADGTLALTVSGLTGTITVDGLEGGNISLSSLGATTVEHAEAAGDFIASVGSFTTGLNSIITGGNIDIVAPGAVDLGNSSAGGFVQVSGQSIAFNSIDAGQTVSLSANDAIDGGAIAASGNINLFANSVALTGPVTGDASFFAFGIAGAVSVDAADVAGTISIFAADDLTGNFVAGGNIFLNSDANITASAIANGGYVDPNGAPTEGDLFVIAAGDANLTASGAARMFGVSAGGAASIDGGTAGEDMLVLAGTTASLANVTAGDDVTVQAPGIIIANGVTATGAGADTHVLGFTTTSGSPEFTITAQAGGGADVVIASTTDAIDGTSIAGQDVTLTGATGIDVDQVTALGATSLASSDGNIRIGALFASGPIDASANAIRIEGGGDMAFQTLTTDVGDAFVRASGDLSLASGSVAGTADLGTQGAAMTVTALTAANATLASNGGFLDLDTVTVAGDLSASAASSLGITGIVTGQTISLASADIAIDPAGRVGTAGVTTALSVANNNDDNQTFVGGAPGGSVAGYHLDADELTRLYGTQIEIFAPEVASAGGNSVGSTAPPDVIVDSFTLAGGAAGSNLGANGALTIRTPGKMRVIGNVELTGLTDANALNLVANDALEVILGQGSVRLVNGPAAAGQLNLVSDDIIIATAQAIADVGAATTTDSINTRLAENDGIVLDEGALFARGIRAEVVGGFYVQNSGAGTELDQRRGLTFGAGGLDVVTEGPSRIVINGMHLGPSGPVTGLQALQLVTVNGSAPTPGAYDPRSTVNGCLLSSPTVCTTISFDDGGFPVQDVIEEEINIDEDGPGEGNNLPQALITMRDVDPLSGEPLVDDPVTGAGNDDLWTPPAE
ncbi:MAG: beta strand repeat-containing protein [Sphingopyxis sp.]